MRKFSGATKSSGRAAQKSPHALAARSALDIDFTDLEEGDLVVHLQHGIGRYLGLKICRLATAAIPQLSIPTFNPSETECLVIEYAPANAGDEPPKLYVPVSEAHLVSKYVGAGKANPPLNTLGGTRWAQGQGADRKGRARCRGRTAAHPGRARNAGGPRLQAGHAWQREFESAFIYEETPDQVTAIAETKADMERPSRWTA
jgi:transcription-repair coupling factor (superfamily II helicase)